MKIGLIGAGRLGICLALLIERAGYDVLVSDVREDYVSNLNKKKIDTNEPGVRWYLKQTKRFEATTDNQRVINECDIIICLVATPSLDDGSYDISSVWKVVEDFKSSSAKLSGKTFIVGCHSSEEPPIRYHTYCCTILHTKWISKRMVINQTILLAIFSTIARLTLTSIIILQVNTLSILAGIIPTII